MLGFKLIHVSKRATRYNVFIADKGATAVVIKRHSSPET